MEDKLEKQKSFKMKFQFNPNELINLIKENDNAFLKLIKREEIGKILDKCIDRQTIFSKKDETENIMRKYFNDLEDCLSLYNECFEVNLFELAKRNNSSKKTIMILD